MKYLVMHARQVACYDAGHFFAVQELTEAYCVHLLKLAAMFRVQREMVPNLHSMLFDEHMRFLEDGVVTVPDPDQPGELCDTLFSELFLDEPFALVDAAPSDLREPAEPVLGGQLVVDEREFYYEGFQEEEADIQTEPISFDQVREWREALRAGG